jgi:hypothetical protein
MSLEDLNSRTTADSSSSVWADIASSSWQGKAQDRPHPIQEAQAGSVVVKPVEVNGETVIAPVTICPPGSARGIPPVYNGTWGPTKLILQGGKAGG